jgi:16S rRNA G966 N2-methylase RsmD
VIANVEATWFIDPPYQKAGKYYTGHNKMDFEKLGEWCKSRKGQVIVCENQGADWLPFRFLTEHRGSMQKNTEVIWTNDQ